jgi:hypothetical protein
MLHGSRLPILALGGALLVSGVGCGNSEDIDFPEPTGDSSSSTTASSSASGSGSTSSSGGGGTGGADSGPPMLEPFSFFVTSLRALQELSGSPDGFGGDLSFGETGPGAGLRGADKICATIAEKSMPGAGQKQWRAFLSAVAGEDGNQVNAIDRVGEGPWYDRLGRVVAMTKPDLIGVRPAGIDPAIKDDLPNEDGVPNHQPDPNQPEVDNHDTLTGSNAQGTLYSKTATCKDWTSAKGDLQSEGRPRVGHSWPRYGGPGGNNSGAHWISSLDESGCAPGVNLIEMGPPQPDEVTVGSGGGYGGFYCFALTP